MSGEPFSALGLAVSFDLTRASIEAAYLARIAAAHPDRAEGQDVVGDTAATLNEARRALLNDEKRANIVLAAMGGPAPADDASLPEGFLFEIMDVRTEIEEALAAGDPQERTRWQEWAAEQRKSYSNSVSEMFRQAKDESAGAGHAEIRQTLNAWRYIERLIEQLDPGYNPSRADFS